MFERYLKTLPPLSRVLRIGGFVVIFLQFLLSLTYAQLPLEKIKLPEGFKIELYAPKVPNARSMVLGDKGTLFVGSRTAGMVYALVDLNQDQKADGRYVIAKGLRMPNGVAFKDGALYVAEVNRILRFDHIEDNLDNPPKPVVVTDQLPKDGWHGWKFIRFGPDDLLYVPVGAPCNVCEREDERYSSILRMKPDGSQLEVFAHGVRNSVGFDWDPQTEELWFSDNGRDGLGDNVPPDELNHAPKKGLHFGFPYCHAGEVSDPEFGTKASCADFVKPAQKLGAHVAGLGLRFYTGGMFPDKYHNQIFLAEHGSWDRTTPLGYRVMLIELKANKESQVKESVRYKIFAEGWLNANGKPWGRPVDVLVMPDGALLVSDDHAGVIYRISYSSNSTQ